jgi:hypothetical protein
MVLAFPGAQGFGKDTIGGRGGRIVHVTNRNNSGTGSFRDAVETQSGARTVVFDVGGTITLTSNINITNGNITIAGESAPSPGIAITGGDIRPRASEIIIRHISFHSSGTVGSSPTEARASTTSSSTTATSSTAPMSVCKSSTAHRAAARGRSLSALATIA